MACRHHIMAHLQWCYITAVWPFLFWLFIRAYKIHGYGEWCQNWTLCIYRRQFIGLGLVHIAHASHCHILLQWKSECCWYCSISHTPISTEIWSRYCCVLFGCNYNIHCSLICVIYLPIFFRVASVVNGQACVFFSAGEVILGSALQSDSFL